LILSLKLVGEIKVALVKKEHLCEISDDPSDSCGEFLMRFQNADCSVFCPFNLYDYGLSQPTKHGPYGTVNGQANGQMAKWPGSKACG